jgi:hypothetical protein
MKINLIYQTYARQHFSADDYFDSILSKIDKTYTHFVSKVLNIYVPISVEEVEDAKKKGRMVIYLGEDQIPNLVAKQIIVSFLNIDENYTEVRDFLIAEYGEKATKYEVIEESFLNDIN